MNKKYLAFFSLLIILTFIGYIVYDTIKSDRKPAEAVVSINDTMPGDKWQISKGIAVKEGLKAVTASADGDVYAGGESFVACYNSQMNEVWQIETPARITALVISGDTLFAASEEVIYLINPDGEMIGEWGPYESNSLITSVSADNNHVAFADAGNKRVFILKKNGEVVSMIGQRGEKLLIPSPYFDVYLGKGNIIYLANTGNFRIETWSTDGQFLSSFGKPGTAPEAFCGCCNPAHFTVIPRGFITAEKGINRIKILNPAGGFVEYVSSENDFVPSAPLDVVSPDGKTIYAANSADSKLYVFTRK